MCAFHVEETNGRQPLLHELEEEMLDASEEWNAQILESDERCSSGKSTHLEGLIERVGFAGEGTVIDSERESGEEDSCDDGDKRPPPEGPAMEAPLCRGEIGIGLLIFILYA